MRSLDERKNGNYHLLLADSPSIALVGMDFRSYDNGVLFITMKPFVNQRQMLQAANRVGRGGDSCQRMIVGDIELVDHLASCRYKNKLIQYLDIVQAQKKITLNVRATK